MNQLEGQFFMEIGERFENRIKYLDSNRKDHTYFAIDFHLWRYGDEEGTNRNGKYFIMLQNYSDFTSGKRDGLMIRKGIRLMKDSLTKLLTKFRNITNLIKAKIYVWSCIMVLNKTF